MTMTGVLGGVPLGVGVAEDGLGAGIKKVTPPERVRGRLNKAGVTTGKYRAQGG